MIITKNKATNTQISVDKSKDVTSKKRLEARWQTINGKLICHWVKV